MPFDPDRWMREDLQRILIQTLSTKQRLDLAMVLPLEQRLEVARTLSPEQLLEGLTPEQRLAGLSPESRTSGLSPDQLEDYLRQIWVATQADPK